MPPKAGEPKYVKCLVWDLDETLWRGTLIENDEILLRDKVLDVIQTLDARGILQSIASKNDYATTMHKLKQLGIDQYFLYPQISWSSKVVALQNIASSLNIGIDSLALIDDQAAERDEVQHSLPDTPCYDAKELDGLLDKPELHPRFITGDSRKRRSMYMADIKRNKAEDDFVGPKESFLAELGMRFTLSFATEEDLKRAEELTVRTHQLNTTGYTYNYDELNEFRHSPHHDLYIAELSDKYGEYGKIGLALVELDQAQSLWTIKLLLMSCRVMNRGVGTIMLNHIMKRAQAAGAHLRAEYIPNGRNRMMLVTYTFAGFSKVKSAGDLTVLECDLSRIQDYPDYITVNIETDAS